MVLTLSKQPFHTDSFISLGSSNMQKRSKFNTILSKPKVFSVWLYSTVRIHVQTACINLYQIFTSWFHKMTRVADMNKRMWLSFDFGAIFTHALKIGAGCHINIFSLSECLLGRANSWQWETGLDFRMTILSHLICQTIPKRVLIYAKQMKVTFFFPCSTLTLFWHLW